MIELYCRGHHGTPKGRLCPRLRGPAGLRRRAGGPLPAYSDQNVLQRLPNALLQARDAERIRQVMRWSGPRMLFHHPVLAVRHLAETRKQKKGQSDIEYAGRGERSLRLFCCL